MIDFFIAYFVAHIKIIHLVCGLLTAGVYMLFHSRQFRLSGIISAGVLGAGVPVGILLIVAGFRPELTDKLREFPLETGILGLVYIVYVAREIWRMCKSA